jgi:hypothetical protein
LKFDGKEKPARKMGSVFPKDEAPSRASLGDMDQSKWPKARFGDDVEDPWTAVIEIPMTHKESGETYIFVAMSKTSLAAAKDFLRLCQKVPQGHIPVVKLGITTYKSKYGAVKKPVLAVTGKSPANGSKGHSSVTSQPNLPFDDSINF